MKFDCPEILMLNGLFFSGPEVSRFLQVSSIADLVLDVSKILAARNFAEIFLFCTVLGKVLLFTKLIFFLDFTTYERYVIKIKNHTANS